MGIFEYAYSVEQSFFKKPLAEYGYNSFTTYYSDLTLAECVEGIKGVRDTIRNVHNNWLNDYKYFTEFIMAINYKQFEMDYRINHRLNAPHNTPKEYLEYYAKAFQHLEEIFYEHYKDNQEALDYYYRTTD